MGIYNLGGGGGTPELQAKEATPLITNAQQIILPDEGYDGLNRVTVNPMPTGTLKTPTVNSIGYVSSGVQTAGYFGTSATSGLQLSTQAAKTITPTTYSQTAVASGKYTTGNVTVAGDANLVSSNINPYKTIYGIQGAYTGSAHTYVMTAIAQSARVLYMDMGIYLCFNKAILESVIIYYSDANGNLAFTNNASSIQAIAAISNYGIPMSGGAFDKPIYFYGGTTSNPYYKPYVIENQLSVSFDSSHFTFTTEVGAIFNTSGYYTAIAKTILTQPD